MLVSVNWLKKYVQIPVDTQTLAHDLTMIGNNVEHIRSTGSVPPGFCIGYVEEAVQHPNADRLRLCRVDVGEDAPIEVVCGAPNVAAGQYVPVAQVGTTLPGGLKIKKTKIRGEVSNGMICSEIELGLGDDAAGIMVLSGEYKPGTPFEEALPPPDEILDIEVTPNRPDLLSHLGVAREIAALYRLPLKYLVKELEAPEGSGFELEIEDGADCPRYVGRMIRGIKVGPSPDWLIEALEAVGGNSVNNIVDITNYILMETGQPLHAFDFDCLKGGKIIVRRGRDGEKLTALNEEKYSLGPADLIIADARNPVAVAGVIGGLDTMVTGSTTNILLESASFNATRVRRTRKAMNLITEASYRFERGSNRELCRAASDQVCQLIAELAGGEPGEVIDRYLEPWQPDTIEIRREKSRRLLGVDIPVDEITDHLSRLEFKIVSATAEAAEVQAPSYRLDIREEADLIEEVARMYGYDRIGNDWSFRTTAFAQTDPFDRFTEDLIDFLCARGLTEVITSSFTDGSEDEVWGWPEDDKRRRRVIVRNPLNVLQGFMRTSLLPGMIEVVRRNMDHGTHRMKIFQIGKIFERSPGQEGLPEERKVLSLVITRPADKDFWKDSKEHTDVFEIKREIEILAEAFGVDIAVDFRYDFDRKLGEFVYKIDDEPVIEGGIVPGTVADKFDFEQPVWVGSLDLTRFYRQRSQSKRFTALPEYPVSKRDLSLVAGESVTYREIEKALVNQGGRLLESIQVFDVYRGGTLEEGKTAYGVRLQFRSMERTLTDKEIDKIIGKMVTRLNRDLDVALRS